MRQFNRYRASRQPARRWHPLERLGKLILNFLAMSWPQRLACVGGAAAALFVAYQLCLGLTGALWASSGRLPTSVAGRAPLFTEAWVAGDQPAMLRYVRPADAVQFQRWLAATAAPAGMAHLRPADRKIKTESFAKDDADGAVVTVRISAQTTVSAGGTNSGDLVQRQAWTYAGGNWYFVPEMPAAEVAADDQTGAPSNVIFRRPPGSPALIIPPSAVSGDDEDRTPTPRGSGNVIKSPTRPPWARGR